MKITHVDHIGINTLDIEESIRWYADNLDFRLEKRVDTSDILTLCYMVNDDGVRLELFDNKGNTIAGERPEDLQGFRHIAFYVDDINAWNERLKANGVKFTMELTRMPLLGCDGILIMDPNGYIIELSSAIR